MKLDPRVLDRLVKLLGMLGSNHDGERAAAALKANALMREHGLVWSDVIPTPIPNNHHRTNGAKDLKQDNQKIDWREMRDYCARWSGLLRPREQEFIDNIEGWQGALTPKQRDWLTAIYNRIR